jgi:DNA-binding MarR family transcriptional regulator
MSSCSTFGRLQISKDSGYDCPVGADQPRGKRALAADVWRLMAECSMAQFGRATEMLQPLGLTPGHVKLMMKLEEGVGRAMGSLAQSFHCDASTMTWLVDRLEERGLVERRSLPSDRRVKAVALTQRGVAMKGQLMERVFEPPDEFLTLDLDALMLLEETLTKVRDSSRREPEGDSEPQRTVVPTA